MMKAHPNIYIPKLFPQYTSSRILLTEFIDNALKINDVEEIKAKYGENESNSIP